MAEKGKIVVDAKFVIFLIALVIIATSGSALLTNRLFANSAGGLVQVKTIPEFGPRVELDTVIVNLFAENSRNSRYLRVKIVMELKDDKAIKELDKFKPILQDKIISILRDKSAEELNGGDSQVKLSQEIRSAFNNILPGAPVISIYFVEFIIS